jgi:glutamate-1-semialdehyde 2,1-aminomutase
MPPGTERGVITCGYNDVVTLKEQFRRHGSQVAAVIVEPVLCNSGVIPPARGFLEECRRLCTECGALLIFDEVITGFRLGLGGAQKRLGVIPDLTTLGKPLANGMPISAVAGRVEVMEKFSPLGRAFLAGTFYGHVLNVAVANACLSILEAEPPYARLDSLGEQLRTGVDKAIHVTGVNAQIHQVGSAWSLYFTRTPIDSYRDLSKFPRGKNYPAHNAYRRWMLTKGIYIHPHTFVRGYLTCAHSEKDVQQLVDATYDFFRTHLDALNSPPPEII